MDTPRLSVLRLDFPCKMPWEEMRNVSGNGSVRYCSQCVLNVTDLSSMTADEAEAFLARNAGERTCVSYMRDVHAKVVTLDYQKANSPKRTWAIISAAGVALAAGGAAAYHQMNPVVVMGRPAGGLMVAAPIVYSPFIPATSPQCASQTNLTPIQLKSDSSLKPMLSALPEGVEVLDLQYGVYPPQFLSGYGRCISVGRRTSPPGPSNSFNASDIRAVVWLMPYGYQTPSDLPTVLDPHPLRPAGRYGVADVFIWSDDAELERSILAALLGEPVTTTTTTTNPDPTALPAE